MNQRIKPISNIDDLLKQAQSLQSDPSLQSVLTPYPVPQHWSAYGVLLRYKRKHQLYQDAKGSSKIFWREAIARIEPAVKAIAQYLEEQHHD